MAAQAKYNAVTRQISVTVFPTYLDDESVPEHNRFFWAYHVVIENQGPETVQLFLAGVVRRRARAWHRMLSY
jgi:uncharacterized protein affecting Mg2+/Co2+ transport